MKIELTNKEATILWGILNQCQDHGLRAVGTQMKQLGEHFPESWLDEAIEEYDMFRSIKTQISTGLEQND